MEDKKKPLPFVGRLFQKEEDDKGVDLDSIKRKAEKLKEKGEKVGFLKKSLEQAKETEEEKEVRKLLIDALKRPSVEYVLGYDSFSQGLEPVYFWILDFLKDRLGFEVDKTKDDFEASVGGLFYGDIGTRAGVIQDRAMKMMGTINTLVRSIINLIYDLREFDIRLDIYNDLGSKEEETRNAADLNLRGVWMDQVDIKRGRGSINSLAQSLQFVTLRDAFLYAKDVKSVDKIDLNERVKRILRARLEEYFKWKKFSEKELRKRYDIEKAYLKSQVNSLKLYSEWAKPYFIAAQKLKMDSFDSPNIVSTFNNLELHLELFSKKKVNIQGEIEKGNLPKNLKSSQDYYSCIVVEFVFRTVPQTVRQTQAATQFSQGGKVDVKFKGFSLGEKDLEFLKNQELFEGLEMIEGMIDTSLVALKEDLDKYMKDENKKKKKKSKSSNPIFALYGGFKDLAEPIKGFKEMVSFKGMMGISGDALVKKIAEGTAIALSYTVYDIYKKAHGMLSW